MSTAAWPAKPTRYDHIESRIPYDRTDGFQSGKGGEQATDRRYVKYVPVGYTDTHSKTVGYLLWLIGFTGAHRFYYGKPLSGVLWFFTFGLLGIGWVVDLFLIPSMDREADQRFAPGSIDYNLTWLLLVFAGAFGLHRFVQGRWFSGLVFFFTFGLAGVGVIFDILTLNDQIDSQHRWAMAGR